MRNKKSSLPGLVHTLTEWTMNSVYIVCPLWANSIHSPCILVVLYMGKGLHVRVDYRIVGYFRWVQIFAIFADRPPSVKIKTTKKSIKIDVIMCVRRYKLVHDAWMRWFSTVSLPSFGFCREESLCQYTKCQQTCRDASKLSKSTLAVLFPSVIFHPRWQSWYFRKSKALHTKGRLGHCFTSLLLLFVIQCRFFGSLMGRGHQLVVPHSIAQGIQFTQLPFGANSCPCQLLHEAN